MKKNINYIYWLLAATLLVIITLGLFWPINQDEGIFLLIGREITRGHLPYQDFFDHKPPGIYYLLAPFSMINGTGYFYAARVLMALINILTAFIIYRILRKFSSKDAGFIGAGLFLAFLPVFEGNLILSEVPMAFFLALGLWFLSIWMEKEKLFFLTGCGLAIGLALSFKQPAFINFFVFLFIIARYRRGKELIKNIIVYTIPVLLIIGSWIIYLWQKSAFHEMINQVLVVNFVSYPPTKAENIAKNFLTLLGISIPLWSLAIIGAVKFWKERNTLILLCCLSIIACLPILLYRHYPHYWVQILPFTAILGGFGWDARGNLAKGKIWDTGLIVFYCLYLSGFCFIAWKIKIPLLKEQMEFSRKVRETSRTEMVYTTRFASWIYALSDKQPAAKYLYLNELDQREGAEQKVVESLQKKKPPVVVWSGQRGENSDPYAKAIRKYILTNYGMLNENKRLQLEIYQRK